MHTDTETLANALAEIARLQAEVKRQEWVIRLWRDVHYQGNWLVNVCPKWHERWELPSWKTAAEHYAQEIVEAAMGKEGEK